MPQPDPIWSYFIQLEHVPKREENVKNVNTKLTIHSDLHAHILKIVLKLQLHKKEVILATHMKEVMIQAQIFQLQCQRKLIYISKAEQKSLELTFARSIFRCGLFLSLPE